MVNISSRVRKWEVKRKTEKPFPEWNLEELIDFYKGENLDFKEWHDKTTSELEDVGQYFLKQGFTNFNTCDLTAFANAGKWIELSAEEQKSCIRKTSSHLNKIKKSFGIPYELEKEPWLTGTNCFRFMLGSKNGRSVLNTKGYDVDNSGITCYCEDKRDVFSDLKISYEDIGSDVNLPKITKIGFDDARILGNIFALCSYKSYSKQIVFSLRRKNLDFFNESTHINFEKLFNKRLTEEDNVHKFSIPQNKDNMNRGEVFYDSKLYHSGSHAIVSYLTDYLGVSQKLSSDKMLSGMVWSKETIDGFISGYLEYKASFDYNTKQGARSTVCCSSKEIADKLQTLLQLRNFSSFSTKFGFFMYAKGTRYYGSLIKKKHS